MAPKSLNCDHCSQESFATKNELDEHLKKVHPFRCPQCEEIFAYKTELLKHQQRNHPKSRHRVYPCNVKGCEAKFSTSFLDMYAHELQAHGIERPYECEVKSCLKRFSTTSNRGRHLKEEHKDFDYKFKCPACNMSSKSEYVRDKHYQTKHVEPQPPKPKRVRKRKAAETSSRPAKTLKLQPPASIQVNGQVISMQIQPNWESGAKPIAQDILYQACEDTGIDGIKVPTQEIVEELEVPVIQGSLEQYPNAVWTTPTFGRTRHNSEESGYESPKSVEGSPNSVEGFQPLEPITEEDPEEDISRQVQKIFNENKVVQEILDVLSKEVQ